MRADKKILLLAGKGLSTNIVFHAINSQYEVAVVLEQKESSKKFLKRRIKKLGFFTVAGQVLYQAIIVPMLKKWSAGYIQSLIDNNGIDSGPIKMEIVYEVPSVNDSSVVDLIKKIAPDVVV